MVAIVIFNSIAGITCGCFLINKGLVVVLHHYKSSTEITAMLLFTQHEAHKSIRKRSLIALCFQLQLYFPLFKIYEVVRDSNRFRNNENYKMFLVDLLSLLDSLETDVPMRISAIANIHPRRRQPRQLRVTRSGKYYNQQQLE